MPTLLQLMRDSIPSLGRHIIFHAFGTYLSTCIMQFHVTHSFYYSSYNSPIHPPQVGMVRSHKTLLTSVREPPWFACLYCNPSYTCIGMFKSHLLHPYCMFDLWTTIHSPNMGVPSVPPRSVDHTRVSVKLFFDS